MNDTPVYAAAAAMGAVAGMRTLTAPAMLGRSIQATIDPKRRDGKGVKTLMVLAATEFLLDKMPFVPKRTRGFGLVARAASGAFTGAAICHAKHKSILAGAVIGAVGATAAAYAAYEIRKRAGEHFHVPDAVIAVIEDAIAVGAAQKIASSVAAL